MNTENDRELLELAAKVAGMDCGKAQDAMFFYCEHGQCGEGMYRIQGNLLEFWSPLTDDGDALRLAVKLDINVYVQLVDGHTMASAKPDIDAVEAHGTDPYAATRRAIVRAAAEIGREMKW